MLESSPADLEELVHQIGGAVTSPYLSLHGIDPGDGYKAWLEGAAIIADDGTVTLPLGGPS